MSIPFASVVVLLRKSIRVLFQKEIGRPARKLDSREKLPVTGRHHSDKAWGFQGEKPARCAPKSALENRLGNTRFSGRVRGRSEGRYQRGKKGMVLRMIASKGGD